MSQAKIHDVRYRPYEGEIKGSTRRAVGSMARWSALRALGARRPWTAKIVPVGLALVAFGPAITVLGIKALLGSDLSDRLPGDIIPFATYYQLVAFAIVTETVFQWPGMGLLFIQAVGFSDIPVMAAYLLFVGGLFVLINTVVDLIYVLVDPRLRVRAA